MPERDSWAVQASGPTGMLDVEEARVAMGIGWARGSSGLLARSGIRVGTGANGLVQATGTPDGFVHVQPFQLVLQTGRAAIGGPYLCTLDAIKDINVLGTAPADPTNPRDDLIVAQQSDTFYGDANSLFVVRHVVGTPSGSPTDPAVSGSTDYVALARVRVGANVTTITGANITDLRTSGHAKSLTGGLHTVALGGILPVASQAQRDALGGLYAGLPVWRTDTTPDRLEVYDGTAWLPFERSETTVLIARKAGATGRVATTQVADPDLFVSLPVSTSWDFTALLLVTSSANAAGDLAFQFTYPTGCIVDVGHLALHDSIASGSSASAEGAGVSNSTVSPTTLMAAGASTAMTSVLVWGRITVGATPGNLALTWGLLSAVGTTTLNIGSNLTARKVA